MNEGRRRMVAVGAYLAGATVTQAAQAVGRTARWLRKWRRRFRDGCRQWECERSRAPHHPPGRAPDWLERLILRVRARLETRRRAQYGAQAIRQVLAAREVEVRGRPVDQARLATEIGAIVGR